VVGKYLGSTEADLRATVLKAVGPEYQEPDARRALHWVLKIGNLKQSLRFFEGVLGLRVLRHEEFQSGCEGKRRQAGGRGDEAARRRVQMF
jgi:hypothetical protein